MNTTTGEGTVNIATVIKVEQTGGVVYAFVSMNGKVYGGVAGTEREAVRLAKMGAAEDVAASG
jgi:hypothetical protein